MMVNSSVSSGTKLLEVVDPSVVEVLQSRYARLQELVSKYRNFTNKYVFNCNCATNIDLNSEYNELELQYKRFVAETNGTIVYQKTTTTTSGSTISGASQPARTLVLTAGGTSSKVANTNGRPSPVGANNFTVLINPSDLYRSETSSTSSSINLNGVSNHHHHQQQQPHHQQHHHSSIIATTANHQQHTSIIEPQVRGVTNILSRRLTGGVVGTSSAGTNYLTTTSQPPPLVSHNNSNSPMSFLTSPSSSGSSSSGNHLTLNHHTLDGLDPSIIKILESSTTTTIPTSAGVNSANSTNQIKLLQSMPAASNTSHNHQSNLMDTLTHVDSLEYSPLQTSFSPTPCSVENSTLRNNTNTSSGGGSKQNVTVIQSVSQPTTLILANHTMKQEMVTSDLPSHLTNHHQQQSNSLQSNLSGTTPTINKRKTKLLSTLSPNSTDKTPPLVVPSSSIVSLESLSTPTTVITSSSKSEEDLTPSVLYLDNENLTLLETISQGYYRCETPDCGYSTSVRANMSAHLRTQHGVIRPFRCTFPGCEASFKEKYKLKVHAVVHTKEKPFVCDHPGCKSRFSQSGHLSRHKKMHGDQAPRYECTVAGCSRNFIQKHSLKYHLMMHRGEKPWECSSPNCGRKFIEKWKLMKHLKIHLRDQQQQQQEPQTTISQSGVKQSMEENSENNQVEMVSVLEKPSRTLTIVRHSTARK